MKFGLCCGADAAARSRYPAYREAGYDYLELPMASVADLSGAEFAELRRSLEEAKIPCEACNCFFPGGRIPLTGLKVSEADIRSYTEKIFRRLRELGADIAVLGSGGARAVPEGFPPERAREQLGSCCKKVIAPLAREYGITVAIEPLNRGECNLICTVADGLDFVRSVGDGNIRLLADFYHMSCEKEPDSVLTQAAGFLRHVHLGSAARKTPDSENRPEYARMLRALRSAGYDGRASVEAGGDPLRGAAILRSIV